MNIEQLKHQFANPPSTYTFAPFWFLNHELSHEELRWQIREMNDNGVKGFILHARHGLITQYLSEDWFGKIQTCIEEADKLGMKAYLYDENNWPSGTVDGTLIEKYPEYRASVCALTARYSVMAGKRIRQRLETRDGLIAVVAVPVEKNTLIDLPNSAILLDDFVCDGLLEWEASEDYSKWAVFVFAREFLTSGTFFGGYLDTLNKDAVAKFVEMTYVEYTDRFSKYFGGTVDGIFTDEPSMTIPSIAPNAVPFSPCLIPEFGWRQGYEFYKALPAVFADAGEATAQLRCDFYDLLSHVYQHSFFRQIYEYCDPLRLNLIGHVLYEGETYECIRNQGDYFRGAQYMHFGGCDQLCDVTWPVPGEPGHLNNLVGPKLASSAAHHYAKPRVMCECFGLAGDWRVDLRLLKCLTDWLVAMGVNMIEPHAFYYSIQGERKWECPPGEFYQSAFWPYYKYFADYAARLCSIFNTGDHVADVAVLYPTRSMWATINPGRTEESQAVVKGFELVTAALTKAGYDYDIVPEEVLVNDMNSSLLNNLMSGETYRALVVPTCTTMLAETADFILHCIDSGVVVILAGDPPSHLVNEGDGKWIDEEWSQEVFMEQFGAEYDPSAGNVALRTTLDGVDSAIRLPDVLDKTDEQLAEVFANVCGEYFDADVRILDAATKRFISDIVHCHYRRGDNDFYFFVNTNRERGFDALISLDTIGVPAIWNPETGGVVNVMTYEYDGERTNIRMSFEPCESYLISVSTTAVGDNTIEIEREPKYGKIIELSGEWEFAADKLNALPLTQWQFSMADTAKHQWAGGWHSYATEFECEAELTGATLLIDGLLNEKIWRRSTPIHTEIRLNGEIITGFQPGKYIDHMMMEADVLEHIKRGKNVLQIICNSQLAPAGNLEHPVYLLGDFEVREQAGKQRIVPAASAIQAGDWAKQGYPFYSGIGIYKQNVKLPRTTKRVYLQMDHPGDLAEVIVNGEFAAVLAWEPWVADITDLVKSGDNEIVIKVANAMANVFLTEPKPSGLLGAVKIAITK
ncbi:MAG: hypothetical protein GX139_08665 [Armatimonadetes bacterium]|nr:hypothetical protein [Armatimonadota bacterium]